MESAPHDRWSFPAAGTLIGSSGRDVTGPAGGSGIVVVGRTLGRLLGVLPGLGLLRRGLTLRG
ncbi:hypothetical protein [Tersicoccus phoenicis]|uniref:hypothetical protein n=1 Tax=Tersicoccus phoenicis TaxID=554083 RepID=UPI001396671E|nr:hypothetical protein [Tersicoccus phoenicis]